jgi:hypothetical protein
MKYSPGDEVIISTHDNLYLKGVIECCVTHEPSNEFYFVKIPLKPGRFVVPEIIHTIHQDWLRKPYPNMRLVSKSHFFDLPWTKEYLEDSFLYACSSPLDLPDVLDFPLRGTLGDLFVELESDEWRCLRSIKERHPNIKLRAIICSLSPGAEDIVMVNPHIDEIFKIEWDGTGDPEVIYPFKRPKDFLDLDTFDHDPVEFFLTDQEKKKMAKYANEEYIVIHPFARNTERHLHNELDLNALVSDLYDKTGLPIYVVGKSGNRTLKIGSKEMFYIEEKFSVQHQAVRNLINKTNIREAAYIVSQAKYFVGGHSSLCHAAYVSKVRSLVFAPYSYFHYYLAVGSLGIIGSRFPLENNQLNKLWPDRPLRRWSPGFNKLWLSPHVLPRSTTGANRALIGHYLDELITQ